MIPFEEQMVDRYLSRVDRTGEGWPVGINARRGDFLTAFRLQGLPGPHTDRGRHSALRERLDSASWTVAEREERAPVSAVLDGAPGILLREADGFASDDTLHRTDQGVVYGSLRAAAAAGEPAFVHYFDTATDPADPLTALNSALVRDGLYLYVPAGVRLAEPVLLDDGLLQAAEARIAFGRLLCVVEAGATLSLAATHHHHGATAAASDRVAELFLGKGARVEWVESFEGSRLTTRIEQLRIRMEAEATLRATSVDLGGGFLERDIVIDLDGPAADAELRTLYLAGGHNRSEQRVRMNHRQPDCRSFQLVKGIAAEHGAGFFTGRVWVAPGAQHTDAQQQNRYLQLGTDARIHTEPQLEIYADDVRCTHGATVGQMDEEAVFYMRQRGLSEAEARRLQMAGFVDDILQHCHTEAMCRHLAERAEARLKGW